MNNTEFEQSFSCKLLGRFKCSHTKACKCNYIVEYYDARYFHEVKMQFVIWMEDISERETNELKCFKLFACGCSFSTATNSV